METINFSYNWNNKLNCRCFTTLRASIKNKYVGDTIGITLKNEQIAKGKIIAIYEVMMFDLKEVTCRLDTGYSRSETIKIIQKMYNLPEGVNKLLYLILIEKID